MPKASIWLPEVQYEGDAGIEESSAPFPHIEYSRLLKADGMRRKLTAMRKIRFDLAQDGEEEKGSGSVRKMKPAVMAVERWLMHYALKHPQSDSDISRDPVLPMFANGKSYQEQDDLCLFLVQDLCTAKDEEADARLVAAELITYSHNLALELRQEMAKATKARKSGTDLGRVELVSHKHTLDVVFHAAKVTKATKGGNNNGGKRQFLKLNPAHLVKLRSAYSSRRVKNNEDKDKGKDKGKGKGDGEDKGNKGKDKNKDKGEMCETYAPTEEREFLDRLFCLLARYQTIQGHGFQAAVAEPAFEVLNQDMGVTLECFASPLNSTYLTFCSAFADTDVSFGSLGSFFGLNPLEGSFEANPPFVLEVMDHMVTHIEKLLISSEGPMSFVVVVPAWEEARFHTLLSQSPHLRRTVVIAKEDHGFCDGASHQRQDRYDTLVFALQNVRGQQKWPCTDAVEERLRAGFLRGLPTEAMRLRQAKEGRGTADECRGVYKGAKKNMTGEGVMKRKREELADKKKSKKKAGREAKKEGKARREKKEMAEKKENYKHAAKRRKTER